MVRAHFTTFGFHKCCVTASSKPYDSVPSRTLAEADQGSDDSLSSESSELSDCGVWAQDGEADVTVAALEPPRHVTTELKFGKDSQEWFTALVLSFICISCKSHSWDETHPLLRCVPLPIRAHAALIRVGHSEFSLKELLHAFLTHSAFPLGSSVECTLRNKKVVLGVVCALLSKFLKALVESCLGIQPGVTEPPEVALHVWKYLFTMLAFCNQIASLRQGSFRMLPQFWQRRHGEQILRSIKVEFQCGDVRKYAGKRKTQSQIASGLIGRRSRALQLYC